MPGIESAAAASHVPVYRYGMRMTMRPEGYTFAPGEDEGVNLLVPPEGRSLDVGETLRSARRARGETLKQAARFTRIRIPYLKDLESGDVSSLESYPGRIYARYFLREYADHLGLDPQPLVTRFDRDVEPALQPAAPPRFPRRGRHPGRWAGGALILLVAA